MSDASSFEMFLVEAKVEGGKLIPVAPAPGQPSDSQPLQPVPVGIQPGGSVQRIPARVAPQRPPRKYTIVCHWIHMI
jgi:hypothetical protein